MGDPSDDDVPTMTSSADLRPDDDSGADADDQTIQKPPEAVATIAEEVERDQDRTMMAKAPKPPGSTPSPISSPIPAFVPRPAAGLSAVSSDKLPPPPTNPLRPRMPSSPSATATGPVTPAMRPMAAKAAEAAKMDVANPELAKKEPAKKSDSKSDVRTVSSTRGDDDVQGPPTLESEPPPSAPMTPRSPGAAKMAPRPSRPDAPPTIDGDPTDDSITATAPRVPAPIIPLSAPRSVEIRTLDDDDSADETEVKTLAAEVGDLVRQARDHARADRVDTSEADVADDSVTAQAPVHPAAPPGARPPPAVIRIGAKSLMSQSSGAPSTDRPYNPDEEDSVTARSLAVGAEFIDESVTARSPNAQGGPELPAPIDGETEGTTRRVSKKPAPRDPDATEADKEDDSVTAAAPGHLTNMLRVIASPADADGAEDDEEDVQAHTQVMLSAPVKPPTVRGGAGPASRQEPTSESNQRVGDGSDGLGGDRASLGALGVPPRERRHSAPMRAPMASDPVAMGPSPSDRVSRAPFPPIPMPQDIDRKPPYALLVGVVAAISIAIPVILYVVLSSSGGDAAPRVTSQPSPDPVGLTGARPKAGKPGPSTSPTGQRPHNGSHNGRPSPFRR